MWIFSIGTVWSLMFGFFLFTYLQLSGDSENRENLGKIPIDQRVCPPRRIEMFPVHSALHLDKLVATWSPRPVSCSACAGSSAAPLPRCVSSWSGRGCSSAPSSPTAWTRCGPAACRCRCWPRHWAWPVGRCCSSPGGCPLPPPPWPHPPGPGSRCWRRWRPPGPGSRVLSQWAPGCWTHSWCSVCTHPRTRKSAPGFGPGLGPGPVSPARPRDLRCWPRTPGSWWRGPRPTARSPSWARPPGSDPAWCPPPLGWSLSPPAPCPCPPSPSRPDTADTNCWTLAPRPAARGSWPGGSGCPSTASWWAWPRCSRGAGQSRSPGGRSPRAPGLRYTEDPLWWARRQRAEDPAERSLQCLFKYFVRSEAGILNQILIRPSFLYLCSLNGEALSFLILPARWKWKLSGFLCFLFLKMQFMTFYRQ